MRYIIESNFVQGSNWYYVCDTQTGGIVRMFTCKNHAQEVCKAMNDERI